MVDRTTAAVPPGRLIVALNQRAFGRPEAAFYEQVAAPAVTDIVAPVLLRALTDAPAGAMLDVGCGGGAIAARLRDADCEVVGLDPSVPQVRRARQRRSLPCVAATAERQPFPDRHLAAVVSSCAIKHWPARREGIRECVRVLRPGGVLAVVEIDGGDDPGDLRRFAERTGIPRPLRSLYVAFARRSFVPAAPASEAIAAEFNEAGLDHVRSSRIDGLPFYLVVGRLP